jgi:Toastrack DUF4097
MKAVASLFARKQLSRTGALFLLQAFSQTSGTPSQEERFQRSFAINSGGTLTVNNQKGTIHITGSSNGQVVVSVYKRFDGDNAERSWWMSNTRVDFRGDSSRLEVEVQYPNNNCWEDCSGGHGNYDAAVELTIQVPRQINVVARGHKPEMKISSIEGDIRIKSYKSPIEIQSTTGAIHIDTYKDTVRLENVSIRQSLDLRTAKGDAIIDAKSLGGEVNLETEKGSIVVRLPQNAGVTVDYSGSRKASFHSDFPITTEASSSSEVRGTINQGGTRVRLRTVKGSITLERASL